MSIDANLGREERLVIETLRRRGKPIREDEYHMFHQVMDFAGRGMGFKYELVYWNQVDERFNSPFGAVPYSPRLHEIIESLVKSGKVVRDPQNPIEITYC